MSLLENRYGAIATEIYDIDKPFGALPDTVFHLEALSGVEGEILEPACGTGRTLLPLLEAGHRVAGFDLSEDMLAACRARCAERGFSPELKIARYEDFSFDRTFAAMVVPVGSFTLIDDFAVAMDVLRRFRKHLAPGGRLIIDQQTLAFLANKSDDIRSWNAPNGDLLTVHGVRTETDFVRQRIAYRIRYERWRDGKLIASELEPMVQRYWGVEEFALALRATGFGEISVCGNYQRGRAPRNGDRAITFEATAV
jgi:SAM-dependent methyltransferase